MKQTNEQAFVESTVTAMPPTRFERETLKARLTNLGYSVEVEAGNVLVARKADASATVNVKELANQSDDAALEARKREGSAVEREGQWAIDVRVERNRAVDAALAAELLRQLLAP
jgi:hypothetical protein